MMAEGNRKDLRLRYEQPRDKIPIIFNYEGSDSVLEISNRYSIAQIETLLQNIFGVNRKLIGFRDSESGIFYLPSNFVQNAMESPQARYEVYFEKERQGQFNQPQRRQSPQGINNINPFQGFSAGEILQASRNNQILEPPNQMSFIDFSSGSVLDPNLWRQDDSRSISSPNSYHGSTFTDQRNANSRTPTMWSNLNSVGQNNQPMNLGYLSDGRSTNNSRIPTPNRDTRFDYYSSSRETNRLHDQQLYDDLMQLENCDSIDNEFNNRSRYMGGNPLEDSRSARDRDLSIRLQRLTDRLRSHLERPQSPYLKKEQMINYINSLANYGSSGGRLQSLWSRVDNHYNNPYFCPQWHIQEPLISKEDADILQGLINCEDEFIMAAFDIYESDKDEENLFDTLKRLISSNLFSCHIAYFLLRNSRK